MPSIVNTNAINVNIVSHIMLVMPKNIALAPLRGIMSGLSPREVADRQVD